MNRKDRLKNMQETIDRMRAAGKLMLASKKPSIKTYYDIYSEKYDKTAAYIKKRYGTEPYSKKMNLTQFKTAINVAERENREVSEMSGKKFSGLKKLSEDLAKHDIYELSTL